MEEILDFIKEHKLVKKGEIIGVGVSGGVDSMCLLHYLNSVKDILDIDVVGIHINHGIREESDSEAKFVLEKCKEMGVRVYKFTIDSHKLAKDRKLSLETAAREGRYGVFEALIKKDIVDKIALAHHQSDQAETILMHLFRGAGVAGAKGMEPMRDGIYIRPMLQVSKDEILDYASINNIEYVEDNSNQDNSYNRNFVRNVIMKEILSRWPNAIEAINNFSQTVCEDDDYINKNLDMNMLVVDSKFVQLPCSVFKLHSAIYTRMIFKVFQIIGVNRDIERKHIEMIKNLALNLENGKRIKLPLDVVVVKEYGFLTFENVHVEKPVLRKPNKCFTFNVENFGDVTIKRVKVENCDLNDGIYFDYRKVPKDAFWRLREDGDVFEKFGGGTKKLKSIFIDKKIPVRKRDFIPVLASGNEVYVIAGVAVSEKVRVEDVPTCYKVTVEESK